MLLTIYKLLLIHSVSNINIPATAQANLFEYSLIEIISHFGSENVYWHNRKATNLELLIGDKLLRRFTKWIHLHIYRFKFCSVSHLHLNTTTDEPNYQACNNINTQWILDFDGVEGLNLFSSLLDGKLQ